MTDPAVRSVRVAPMLIASGAAIAAAAAAIAVLKWPHLIGHGVRRLSRGRVLLATRVRSPMVALTFDDGPHPATTPRLLDTLAEHGAHATFFVLGEQARSNRVLLERIVREGHELGNHMMTDSPSVRLPADEFSRQLREAHEILSPYGPIRFFRPGSGWFTVRMLRDAAQLGYVCALGSVSPLATTHENPAGVADRLDRRCVPGAVVVLHEGTAERQTVCELTDRLLTRLAVRGLRATTLSELAGLPVHP